MSAPTAGTEPRCIGGLAHLGKKLKILLPELAAIWLISCLDPARSHAPFQSGVQAAVDDDDSTEGDQPPDAAPETDPEAPAPDATSDSMTADTVAGGGATDAKSSGGEDTPQVIDTAFESEQDESQAPPCPTTCEIDVPCQTSACNPATGQCETVAVADGTTCSDGNLCTVGDACKTGACSPGPGLPCDDQDACTNDGCDPYSGACIHVAMNCDDANQCTLDSCAPGLCKHDPAADGTACGQSLSCVSGICTGSLKIVQVSMGQYTACALRNDGTVWCWGSGAILSNPLAMSDTPTPTQIPGLSDIVAIDVGHATACALSSTGKVWCWGRNDHGMVGQALLPGGGESVLPASQVALSEAAVEIGCGRSTSCAALASGKVVCWGSNETGELGAAGLGIPYPKGPGNYSSIPVEVVGSAKAVEVDVGWNHACARLKDGGCACWGSNLDGQLALDPAVTKQAGWSQVQNLTGVAQLALSLETSCVRRSDGTAACWGYGTAYQLGNGTQQSVHAPQEVVLAGAVKDLACSPSGDGCVALDTAGAVYTWGSNDYNVQGANVATNKKPSVFGNLTSSVGVAAGTSARCAIDAEGSLWCWGRNINGELGAGQMGAVKTPLKIYDSADKAVSISGRSDKLCLVTQSGKTLCWGWAFSASEPTVYAAGPSNAVQVILGDYNPAWLTSAGKALFGYSAPQAQFGGKVDFVANGGCVCGVGAGQLSCWCFTNTYGQQGDGTKITVMPVAPKLVPLSKPVISAACGSSHTCAILSDNSAWCWGDNSDGQLGIGESGSGKYKTSPTPIPSVSGFASIFAGGTETCAIKAGSVYCWGKCAGKTCTALASSPQTTPLEIGVANATQVALGPTHMCALKAGGQLYCWGEPSFVQTGTQSGDLPGLVLDQVSEVAAAFAATCALRTDGTVWCWGANSMGLVGNGFAFTAKPKKVVKIP